MNTLPRVLVVEDDRQIAEVLSAAVAMCGADATIAGTLAEALGAAARTRFALVLLDLGLPDSRFPETLAAISDFHARDAADVVIITGIEVTPTVRALALEAGAAAVIEKADQGFATKLYIMLRGLTRKGLDKPTEV